MNEIEKIYNLQCEFKIGDEDVFTFCTRYFTDDSLICYFPYKSFCVAFIYSRILSVVYNISQYDLLRDATLLPNDPYFIIYNTDTFYIYDFLIENFNDFITSFSTQHVRITSFFCFLEHHLV